MIAKPKRIQNKRYVEWVKTHPCAVLHAHAGEVDAHHLVSRGAGGSDYTCVPLCRRAHTEYHALGISEFEEKHKANLWRDAFNYFLLWEQMRGAL